MALQLAADVVIADRFRINRLIGRGGMGSVWHATHLGLDIPCAVKFIEGEIANHPEAQSRFEREAKAAAQLRSPHVVQILDHGVSQGTPYIAMELLDGEDLGKRLQRVGRMSPMEIATVVLQVCRALTKAHAAGIVHRDLKPDNIFLVRDDDREIAKVLDFGIAKANSTALDGSNTKTGAMLGTPYYMSPEQAQGTKAVDHRADLWSLAIIVFQCITGKLPFESEALGDLLVKIIVNPIPVPSQIVSDVPPAFDRWWERAASRDPNGRFQTAKELGESLALVFGLSSLTDVMDRGQLRAAMGSMADGGAGRMMSPSGFGSTPAPAGMPSRPPMAGTPRPMGTPDPGQAQMFNSTTGAPIARTYSGMGPSSVPPKKRAAVALMAAAGAAIVFGSLGLGAFLIVKGKGDGAAHAPAAAGLAQENPAPASPPSVAPLAVSPPVAPAPSIEPPAASAAAPATAAQATPAAKPARPTPSPNKPSAGAGVAAAAPPRPAATPAPPAAKPAKPASDLGF